MTTIEQEIHFRRGKRSEKQVHPKPEMPSLGRVPRISRLMALALRIEGLLKAGEIESYAEVARLGQVTRNRVSKIMNLLLLAPDLQERLLFLPRIERGPDPVFLKDLQRIAKEPNWRLQRQKWQRLLCR